MTALPHEWVLDSEGESSDSEVSWTAVSVDGKALLCGVLPASGEMVSPWLRVDKETFLFVNMRTSSGAIKSRYVKVELELEDQRRSELAICFWSCDRLLSVRLGLPASAKLRLFVTVSDPRSVLIDTVIVATEKRYPLLSARTHMMWRTRNEIAHFSDVYSNPFYRDRETSDAKVQGGHLEATSIDEWTDAEEDQSSPIQKLAHVAPAEDENAYSFGIRCLDALMVQRPPTFKAPAKDGADRLRVLSLCCGEAGIERMLFGNVLDRLEITLVDLSPQLLDAARSKFGTAADVRTVLANVNDLPQLGRCFDVVIMVSAIHHVVELETLMQRIKKMLSAQGEFWVLGEYVGKKGNRLYPEALHEANRVFAQLPARFRKNRESGRDDVILPDGDCSLGCFEGIRSDQVLDMLRRNFKPIDEYIRNCFLWRILNLSYAANYDLTRREDAELVRQLAYSEWLHWRKYGRGTELFGRYAARI